VREGTEKHITLELRSKRMGCKRCGKEIEGLEFHTCNVKRDVSAVASNDGVMKPCPFCGEQPAYLRPVNTYSGVGETGYIECKNCGCFLPNPCKKNEAEMIEFWNRRAI
jgi:Lar family restriction alleviation protein